MYGVDHKKLVAWLLPETLRQTRMLAWLNALMAPFKTLHGKYLLFISETGFELQMSGQVCRLRWGLNTKYDSSLKRFIVRDASASTQIWTYQEVENNPVYMPFFISGGGYDFEVLVPFDLQAQEPVIRSFIDKHKLPGKRYVIIYI